MLVIPLVDCDLCDGMVGSEVWRSVGVLLRWFMEFFYFDILVVLGKLVL